MTVPGAQQPVVSTGRRSVVLQVLGSSTVQPTSEVRVDLQSRVASIQVQSKSRSPSLSTVISEAATAVAKVHRKEGGAAGPSVGVSPGKAVDLRMKNYQQL